MSTKSSQGSGDGETIECDTRDDSSPGKDHKANGRRIEITHNDKISALALFPNGKYVVGGGSGGKIQRWRVEDGVEVGGAMSADSLVLSLAVSESQDGKWIINGTASGRVTVWNAESYKMETRFKGHSSWVYAVDMSPDGSKIASGSADKTACVWSRSGKRLFGPWEYTKKVVAAKFSPDGQIIATATWYDSIHFYDGQSGRLLFDVPIKVTSNDNQSFVWTKDSTRLFVFSTSDGNVHCLDPSGTSGFTTLSKWPIQSNKGPSCIALASNDIFIAVSDGSSVSFWDTMTHAQIGPLIQHSDKVDCMGILAHNDIVIGDKNKITIYSLLDILPLPYCSSEACLNEKIRRLEKVLQGLRQDLAASRHAGDQKEGTIKSLQAKLGDSNERVLNLEKNAQGLEEKVQQLNAHLIDSHHKADGLTQVLRAHEQKHQCEILFSTGHTIDAATSLLEIISTTGKQVRNNKLIVDWLAEFANRCVSTLEVNGDEASNSGKYDNALAAYATALTLGPSTPDALLTKWARIVLIGSSLDDALAAGLKFKVSRFLVYKTICDILEGDDDVARGTECFRLMHSELGGEKKLHAEQTAWEDDFRKRCVRKLEKLGDIAMDAGDHDTAVRRYSDALSLSSTDLVNIFVKRSKARAFMGLWGDALVDADRIIELDPSSYEGYERKHAALHGMNRYREGFRAFETMLSMIERSSDSAIRKHRNQYFNATSAIRGVIEETVHDMPRVLIETATGRLLDKAQQAAAFRELPIYDELRSSMTTGLDHERIEMEVKKFYRYVMFSHRWEPREATFQDVEKTPVYELPTSPGFNKLKTFCKLVETLGFTWAWSDTCCINQLDKGVQQESLVAMFRWYRGSSLTIIHLLGVFSDSQEFGCLWRSIWNTRGWTYQEYLASMVVQFYTEDWKPYLNLDIFNHKESPTIQSEMEGAMNFASHELATLHPGFDRVREKLYLASARQTTREEDIAYSLFGIFNVALPVVYGEGKQAVGRLLEHILMRSDNVTLLAWTGRSGTLHSYLPLDLTVYNQILPPHVPTPLEAANMDSMVATLDSSLPDHSSAMMLHDRLCDLPSLSVLAGRLKLPGIVFPVISLVPLSETGTRSNLRVYHAATPMLGDIEIKTTDDSFGMEGLLLVHPWINPLVDPDFLYGVPRFDRATCALRLVVRLRQPFGALLLAPLGRVQYRRVATDCLIVARVREEASLNEMIRGIRTVDIQ